MAERRGRRAEDAAPPPSRRPSQSAIAAPIAGALVLLQEVPRLGDEAGRGCPSALANASPTCGRQHRVLGAPQHQQRAARRRAAPPARAGPPPRRARRASAGSGPGRRARRPSTRCSGTARRRRRRPRRRGRGGSRGARACPIGRSSVRSTKAANACQSSLIGCSPVNRPVSMITSRADAVGVLDREAQPDRAAPVVHDERRVAQVEVLEQRRRRSRRGGRRSTSRAPSACPSGRSPRGPGSTTRWPASRTGGSTWRHRKPQVGSPCHITTGAPSPSSTWARRRPSTVR